MVEVIVAMVILAVVLLGAERAVTDSMAASLLAKEHSVATGLASQAVAEAVALPFQDLEEGLNPSATCPSLGGANCLANDPYIVKSGSTYELVVHGSVVPTGSSSIPTSNTNSAEAPIVPEISTVTEGITYTVRTYPTVTSSSPSLVTVVVIVSWQPPTGGTAQVVSEDGIGQP